jgi:hypothetical protein
MNVLCHVHNPHEYSGARLASHFQDRAVPSTKNHDDMFLPSAHKVIRLADRFHVVDSGVLPSSLLKFYTFLSL